MLHLSIDRSIALISPLGQYHWRGTAQRSSPLPQGVHTNEDGDACYHTGILCNALSWAYKNIPSSQDRDEIRKAIQWMLVFFLDGQSIRNGCLIRNIVSRKAYDTFIPQEQHSDAQFSLKDVPAMKYIVEREWCYRYDISIDAISQVMVACYWISRHIPDLAAECRQIVASQYEYYQKSGWMILDSKGKVCRYGIHKAGILNPMAYFTRLLMEHILGMNPRRGFSGTVLNRLFRTYIPGIYRSKETRQQFNNYMATMTLHALVDAGFDFKATLKRLVDETIKESNYYSQAVSNYVLGTHFERISPEYPLRTLGYYGYAESPGTPVPPSMRYGWNAWESSAYRLGIVERLGVYGQEDLIQALYLR